MKFCCFRFDADTHACVSRGIPRLVELADELGVKFTFFVNMGRAFDPRITLNKAFRRATKPGRHRSLSAFHKLGWKESLTAALFNPEAGRSHPAALLAAERSGHEIGLHGGRNHAQWERFAHLWTGPQLRDEIQIGLRWMAECGLRPPVSFASPAWNSPELLNNLLPGLGFRTLADSYDRAERAVSVREGGLIHMPVNVTAEPGSVGYLETMRMNGRNQLQIVRDFSTQLETKESLAVVYDHPFFAGIHALREVREMIRVALDQGFTVGTISAAARGLSQASPLIAMDLVAS